MESTEYQEMSMYSNSSGESEVESSSSSGEQIERQFPPPSESGDADPGVLTQEVRFQIDHAYITEDGQIFCTVPVPETHFANSTEVANIPMEKDEEDAETETRAVAGPSRVTKTSGKQPKTPPQVAVAELDSGKLKKVDKQIRNKASAKKSRNKKNQTIDELKEQLRILWQQKYDDLKKENENLRKELDAEKASNAKNQSYLKLVCVVAGQISQNQ